MIHLIIKEIPYQLSLSPISIPNCICNFDCLYQAFLVGKDFGAIPGYLTAAVHPERVAAVITLGIPFMLPGPSAVESHLQLPKGFYITRWRVHLALQFLFSLITHLFSISAQSLCYSSYTYTF